MSFLQRQYYMLINNLSDHVTNHRAAIDTAIARVLDRSWLVLGPEVKNFEKSFASYIDVDHCITVGNGTDALEIALSAMGVQSGDRVATVANAGMYTTTALQAIGAEPVFMDVDFTTRVIRSIEVNRVILLGVKALVATHLYGQAIPDIAEIATQCHKAGVALLEDCAQAHGAIINGKQVGSFGDAACFSFYPTKNLGALGDGGAIVTHNLALAEKFSSLRQYGWKAKYIVELAGGKNSRLDEMQASILSEFLPLLDGWNTRRREIANIYLQQIDHSEIRLPKAFGENYVAHLFVVTSPKRSALQVHMNSLGIATDIHYPIPDHRQPVFGDRHSKISLPNTEQLAAEVLTLPCYPEMTNAQVQEVINAVSAWKP
jgi:dTDP-4-amino-4,6-dideoxygalactose transaminase